MYFPLGLTDFNCPSACYASPSDSVMHRMLTGDNYKLDLMENNKK